MRCALLLLVVASCGGSQAPTPKKQSKTALGVFMRTQLNPPFSRTSFHLFQDQEGTDPLALPSAATELANVAARLAEFPQPPGDSEQGRQVFYEYAAAMRNDADTLVKALGEGRRPDAAKAFEEIRKKCDSCHHFFRYGE